MLKQLLCIMIIFILPITTNASEKRIPYANPMNTITFNKKEHYHTYVDIAGRLNFIDIYDPFEPLNRMFFSFNVRLDHYVLEPLMILYETVTPSFVRKMVSNFFQNISDIPNTLNNIAQFRGHAAVTSTSRLILNTTFGALGLFDPAEKIGFKYRANDLGITLAHYGISSGPYLMLPILGPSNLRDVSGLVGDTNISRQINFLGVPRKTFSDPRLFTIYGINYRYKTQLTYDDFISPFTYDMIRFLYAKNRDLEFISSNNQ